MAGASRGSVVKAGVDREVLATRVWWYLTEWTGASLPLRPDGKPVIPRRVVDGNGVPMIPELMVARWLGAGASYSAWFDRWWLSRWRQDMYDGTKDDGVAKLPDDIAKVLKPVFDTHGTMDGVWDAMAVRPDGTVHFAEAKRRGSDQIRDTQHRFASVARAVLGNRVSFTIVEWTSAPPLDWRELNYDSEADYLEVRGRYFSDAEYISRDYRWSGWDQDLATWVRSRMSVSRETWLKCHHLVLPRQHQRFFASMDALRDGDRD